jgi:hypothetical protein
MVFSIVQGGIYPRSLFHPKVNQLNSLTNLFSGFDRQYGLPEQREIMP